MFKRFKDGELFVNRIEAHPKVEFFVNDGAVNSVHHNRVVQPFGSPIPDGHVALSNLINFETPEFDFFVQEGQGAFAGYEDPDWDGTISESDITNALTIDISGSAAECANADYDSGWDGV